MSSKQLNNLHTKSKFVSVIENQETCNSSAANEISSNV